MPCPPGSDPGGLADVNPAYAKGGHGRVPAPHHQTTELYWRYWYNP